MSENQSHGTNLTPEQKRALLGNLLKEKALQQITPAIPSDGQRALWFVQQSSPDSFAYHVSFSARITSEVNVVDLKKAIQAVINRHATLRTTYTYQNDILIQQVHHYQEPDFKQVDASNWNDAELYDRVVQADHQVFNLETDPVIRWTLFTRSKEDHIFLITAHHIAIDAGSLWIVLEDLRSALQALSTGQPIILAAEPTPYTEWAKWQEEMLAGPEGENLRAYWQKQLTGSLPLLNLPYDYPHPIIPTTNGDTVTFSIGADQTHRLKALAQAEDVTLFMLLLAAYQVLIYRYTRQDDILVGTPTTGRTHPSFMTTVGYFVNPIPLRVDLSKSPGFTNFLAQVRKTVIAALDHKDYPFIRLVEQLHIPQHPGRSAIFQNVFSMHSLNRTREVAALVSMEGSETAVDFGGLRFERYFFPQEEGQFELMLEVIEASNRLICNLKYQTDIFKRETIERIRDSFEALVTHILETPNTSIDHLNVLSPKETQLQTIDWNQTQFNYPANQCLHQLFETQAQRTPHAVAVVYEDKTITYAQLNARANQLAHHLISHGAHGLVGICMERSIEVIIAFLGVLKAGAAYVPIDPGYPADRLAWMIADSQIQFLLIQENLQEILPETTAQLITLDTGWAAIASQSETNPNVAITPESLAYVIYTSGSTGKPKGAMIPHRAIVNHVFWANDLFQATEKDVFIQKFPFSFDPSVWEVYAPLVIGAKLVMAQPGGHQDGNYIVQLIQEQRVTLTLLVPSLLQLLVETPGFEQCTSLRCVGVGGEALSMALVRSYTALNPAPLINLYGPTETTITTLYWRCEPDYPQTTALIGRPVGNTTLYILDKALQLVPLGVPGELHIGGVQVGAGYFNRPELTAERFIPNPFSTDPQARLYKTGDLARYRPDGMVEFLGRNDSQVKIRGFRIELGEIEAALSQHPAVTQAVVVVREDVPGDKRLTAYYTTSAAPSARELTKFLRDKLPAYMLPSAFVPIDAFPQSPSGKIDARQLPAPVQSAVETHKTLQPPSTPAELLIAEAWKKVLKVEQISTFDNFFDLGGHSLLGMRVVNEIKEKTGHRIEPAYLRFESLGQLAARLEEKIRET